MDWLFIADLPKEGELCTPDQTLLRDTVHAFLKTRPAVLKTEYDLLGEFLSWLKKQPDGQQISYDPGYISPITDATHRQADQ